MKNIFSKKISGAILAILSIAVFSQISVSAQDKGSDEESVAQDRGGLPGNPLKALVGVWDIQVTGRNCQTGDVLRTFSAMQTYMRGGTMSDFGTGNVPSQRSPGMGIWNYESGRRYVTAFQFFRYNADGTLAGKQISRAQLQLSRDGDSYTTTVTAQVLDVNGNVIQNNCSTASATRFQ
jgi:hypothetical protein